MKDHLAPTDFADALISGGAVLPTDAVAAEHLRGCAACSADLAELDESLVLFRSAVSSFAEREPAGLRPWAQQQGRPFLGRAAWLSLAAVLLAAALPRALHLWPTSAPSARAARVPTQAESDEALLREIDHDIAAPVPSPMQPLADPTSSAVNPQPRATQRTN